MVRSRPADGPRPVRHGAREPPTLALHAVVGVAAANRREATLEHGRRWRFSQPETQLLEPLGFVGNLEQRLEANRERPGGLHHHPLRLG